MQAMRRHRADRRARSLPPHQTLPLPPHLRLSSFLSALALAAAGGGAFYAAPAMAQGAEEGAATVLDVVVTGNRRLDDETILTYANVFAGAPLAEDTVSSVVKLLFATGLFNDVKVTLDENILVIDVDENPVINKVYLEGNDAVSEKLLRSEVRLGPRSVFTRNKVQRATERILTLYQRNGLYAATVTPKIVALPDKRVDLVFEIDEGDTANVSRIEFIGNARYSDGVLADVIRSQESRWYRIFGAEDIYDPDRLKLDEQLLQRFYGNNGYLDFKSVSTVAELTLDKQSFILTFTVSEGAPYTVGEVDVASEVPELQGSDFLQFIESETGDSYTAGDVEESVFAMNEEARKRGFTFTRIEPRLRRRKDEEGDNVVDILYVMSESEKLFLEKINISGNTRTREEVIRRELLASEGDVFSLPLLQRSRQRLSLLGVFSAVEFDNRPGSRPDRTIMDIKVKEAPTGELSFSAGFSTTEGGLGNVSLRERNFLGRAQDLGLGFTYSQRRRSVNASFTEPYFLNRNLALTVSAFQSFLDFSDESNYERTLLGGSVGVGYRLFGSVRQNWSYGFRSSDLDAEPGASNIVRRQAGERLIGTLTHSLVLDQRDNAYRPTAGYRLSQSVALAGVGGNAKYVKISASAGLWHSFAPGWVLRLGGRGGHVLGYGGDDVHIEDRFYLGGDTLRGFEFYGVGPRDRVTRDSLGGKTYYALQLEQSFPLGIPEEFGIEGRVFIDAGSLFSIDLSAGDEASEILDDSSLRAAAGVGIAWLSPIGPLSLYFTRTILKEDYDRVENIRFSIGTRF